jgi:thiol-disulfide isomerase/thioredoxin
MRYQYPKQKLYPVTGLLSKTPTNNQYWKVSSETFFTKILNDMIFNRKMTAGWLLGIALLFISLEGLAQIGKNGLITDKVELGKLRAAVTAQIDSLKGHQAYIRAMGVENQELEKQYVMWMKQYPKSAMVPYALGKAYLDRESPKAKSYLLKTVAIDPKFTEAWGGLWFDGERWGDFKVSRDYLARATESDLSNPNYAFYYANSFTGVDDVKWQQLSLDVARRFPNHERGAQALYWLAVRSKKLEDKLKYFELLSKSYAPGKFNWSSGGMVGYFNLLLSTDLEKALALAQELGKDETGERKQWPALITQAQTIAIAKSLIDQKKGEEALDVLNGLKLPKYTTFKSDLAIMKAKANELSGRTQLAYDSLIVTFVKAPKVSLKKVIVLYGSKLSKSMDQVDADIWKQLDANAQAATPFNGLKRYMTVGQASLSDFKGKAVLLTYWFPGCGPCRGEFPHFENVVRKFKGKDLEYIGINIVSEQNDYVVPFMKSSGYSFTPLEDVKDRVKGNLDNRGVAPMNFLLDREGKLMFSNFNTDGENEEDLEMMINMLVS